MAVELAGDRFVLLAGGFARGHEHLAVPVADGLGDVVDGGRGTREDHVFLHLALGDRVEGLRGAQPREGGLVLGTDRVDEVVRIHTRGYEGQGL